MNASIVSKRRFNPSRDLSDATIPTSTPAPSEFAELARAVIARKAAEDAEAILAMLGLSVTA